MKYRLVKKKKYILFQLFNCLIQLFNKNQSRSSVYKN